MSCDGCIFGFVVYFFYVVLIVLCKKKYGYEMKKEKDFFIFIMWFIVIDFVNSFINYVNVFKFCINVFGKYENRMVLDILLFMFWLV